MPDEPGFAADSVQNAVLFDATSIGGNNSLLIPSVERMPYNVWGGAVLHEPRQIGDVSVLRNVGKDVA
jgi:hypothetical protein